MIFDIINNPNTAFWYERRSNLKKFTAVGSENWYLEITVKVEGTIRYELEFGEGTLAYDFERNCKPIGIEAFKEQLDAFHYQILNIPALCHA